MRSTLRITAFILVLLALLAPLATYASNGPCPDDPVLSKECVAVAPPYYVVTNRSVEHLYPERPGTGCQPIILKHPDCLNCCQGAECMPPAIDVQSEVCQYLPKPPAGQTHIVYEMCCDCTVNPSGEWWFRVRLLQDDGTCPIDGDNEGCYKGLPPGTGVDLPAPIIIGGLVVTGAGLLAAGVLVRRRALRPL
jgi:hypothetical protein